MSEKLVTGNNASANASARFMSCGKAEMGESPNVYDLQATESPDNTTQLYYYKVISVILY